MIYTWKCTSCGAKVEVQRSVAEYRCAPEGEECQHDGCSSTEFSKVLTPPSRVFVHENEDAYFG